MGYFFREIETKKQKFLTCLDFFNGHSDIILKYAKYEEKKSRYLFCCSSNIDFGKTDIREHIHRVFRNLHLGMVIPLSISYTL